MTFIFIFIKVLGVDIPNRALYRGSMSTEEREIKLNFTMSEKDFFIIVRSLFVCVHETRWIAGLSKLELWVTSLSDTLPMKNKRIWSYVKETTSHLQNKLTKNIHLGVATRSSTKWDCLKPSTSWIISPS